MVIIRKHHLFRPAILSLVCLFILTGCPGSGDRLQPDEDAQVSMMRDNICFLVPDADDYQPVNIAIKPRDTPNKKENITFNPTLRITDKKLCIPPSFYAFPDKGQFIVGYVLNSKSQSNVPRRIMAGIEISDGQVYNIPLTDQEVAR